MPQPLIFAIDFGTSNSLLGAATSAEKITSIPLDPGAPDATIFRTLLYFPHENQAYYGHQALEKFVEHDMTGRLFRSFKSHLATRSYLGTMVESRPLPLEEMVGLFLLEMRRRAEAHFQREADAIILGRPARYSLDPEADKFAEYRMRKAAEFAGFREIIFLAEPLAAAYEFRKSLSDEKIVLVGDFGGGTSDFSIVRLSQNDLHAEDVLAVEGINVAGDAFDAAIMKHRVAPFFGSQVKYRVPMGSNTLTMPPAIHQQLCQPAHIVHLQETQTFNFLQNARRWALTDDDKKRLERLFVLIEDQQIYSLFEAIEAAKRGLSVADSSFISFDYPSLEMEEAISRSQFSQWSQPCMQDIYDSLMRALKQAQLKPSQIDLVCCTGGTARVFQIQRMLVDLFGEGKMHAGSQFHSVLQGLVEAAHGYARQI